MRTERQLIHEKRVWLRSKAKDIVDTLRVGDVVLALDFDVVSVRYTGDGLAHCGANMLEEVSRRL